MKKILEVNNDADFTADAKELLNEFEINSTTFTDLTSTIDISPCEISDKIKSAKD